MKTFQIEVTVSYVRRYMVPAEDQDEALNLLKVRPEDPDITLEEEEGPNHDWDNATIEELETD